jgi:hypothetical protein
VRSATGARRSRRDPAEAGDERTPSAHGRPGRATAWLVLAIALAATATCQPTVDRSPGGGGPALAPAFSTRLSGAQIRDIAADDEGSVYITGGAFSADFPVTAGAFQTIHNPGQPAGPGITGADVFVAKLSRQGTLLWSTLIGGPNHDRAYAIEVDRRGYVYVAGRAGPGFPVTPGAFQTAFQGGQEAPFYGPQDGFVCKLEPDGSALVFCSYFGTPDARIIRDLAVDGRGDIYVAAAYSSGAYPAAIQGAFNNTPRGGDDAVAARIASDGSRVVWATYLGGSLRDSTENSVRLDGAGNPHVLITTRSRDAPTTPRAFQSALAGGADLYIAKLGAGDGRLVWATYLGGPHDEATETHEFAVDRRGHVYVAVPTRSPGFPTTPGGFRRTYGGGQTDIAVAKLSPDGTALLASSFMGGGGADRAEGMGVDESGRVYFTGATTSVDFPLTDNAFQKQRAGPAHWDAIAVALSADLGRLLYSTYLGGRGDDAGRAAAVHGRYGFYVAGSTSSPDWPIAGPGNPPVRTHRDGFVARFAVDEALAATAGPWAALRPR